MDKKITFEEVSYVDQGTGETVTKLYHTPFVADEDFDTYEPELFDIGPFRTNGAMGIVGLEAFLLLFVVWKVVGGLLGVGGGGVVKRKRD